MLKVFFLFLLTSVSVRPGLGHRVCVCVVAAVFQYSFYYFFLDGMKKVWLELRRTNRSAGCRRTACIRWDLRWIYMSNSPMRSKLLWWNLIPRRPLQEPKRKGNGTNDRKKKTGVRMIESLYFHFHRSHTCTLARRHIIIRVDCYMCTKCNIIRFHCSVLSSSLIIMINKSIHISHCCRAWHSASVRPRFIIAEVKTHVFTSCTSLGNMCACCARQRKKKKKRKTSDGSKENRETNELREW